LTRFALTFSVHTVPVKGLDTSTLSRVFLYFLLFPALQNNSEDINTRKRHTWNPVVSKKVLNKSKYILYLRFFKVATLCLDDSFAHAWHSLNQLHEVVTWNGFQLTGVPC
jgi:hypothetical protein